MKSKKKNRSNNIRKKTVKRKSFKKKTVKRKSFRNKTVKRKRFKKVMKGGVIKRIINPFISSTNCENDKKEICTDSQKDVELILMFAKNIGKCAFKACTSLKSVKFPESLESIEKSAFQDCTSLESIDLSKCSRLKTIEESVFKGCSSLESVKFHPRQSIFIQNNSFHRCFKLCKNLLFPEKIFYIDLSKTSLKINKKIILVGEIHSECNIETNLLIRQEIPSFILELLDRLEDKKLDIFLERDYRYKKNNPPPQSFKIGWSNTKV